MSEKKLITQFATPTIEDAVNFAKSHKLTHIFANPGHKLAPLVEKFGGQENTIRAVLNAANGKFPTSGVFIDLSVTLGKYNVFLRGSVVDNIPKLGTMFIK